MPEHRSSAVATRGHQDATTPVARCPIRHDVVKSTAAYTACARHIISAELLLEIACLQHVTTGPGDHVQGWRVCTNAAE
jgi:hypothetical protein